MRINGDELRDIEPPSFYTNDLGYGVCGIKRYNPFKLNFKTNDRSDEFLKSMSSDYTKEKFIVKFPDGAEYAFGGFVTAVKPGPEGLSVTVQPSGVFKETVMPKHMAGTMRQSKTIPASLQKFYVGSNSIADGWSHADHKTALEHATELVNADGGPDEVFIVEVKTIVRKKEAPVTVTKFKAPKKPRG